MKRKLPKMRSSGDAVFLELTYSGPKLPARDVAIYVTLNGDVFSDDRYLWNMRETFGVAWQPIQMIDVVMGWMAVSPRRYERLSLV